MAGLETRAPTSVRTFLCILPWLWFRTGGQRLLARLHALAAYPKVGPGDLEILPNAVVQGHSYGTSRQGAQDQGERPGQRLVARIAGMFAGYAIPRLPDSAAIETIGTEAYVQA